jgi:hypothetical protein
LTGRIGSEIILSLAKTITSHHLQSLPPFGAPNPRPLLLQGIMLDQDKFVPAIGRDPVSHTVG